MNRHRHATAIGLLILAVLAKATASAASDPPVPAGVVPRGWLVQQQARGDLDRDGRPDLALLLVQDDGSCKPDELCDRPRAVRVLLAQPAARFAPAGFNDRLLICQGCGGVKESVGIHIERGVLLLRQTSGSREYTEQTWRLRHDAASGRFMLIGADTVSADSLLGTGSRESINWLTGLKISEKFRHTADGERRVTLSSRRETLQLGPVTIEELAP